MDPTGPDGAPRDDGLDVRWSSDWRYLVSLNPELREYLFGVCSQAWDQGARQHPAGMPNPFWGLDTEAADAQLRRIAMDSNPLEVLPPKARAAIYLTLIVAAAVLTPLMAGGTIPSYVGSIITGLLGVFGGATALSNLKAKPPAYDAKHDPED